MRQSTCSVNIILVFRETKAEHVGFVGLDLVDHGAYFSVPKCCVPCRITTDNDKVICDGHAPN